MPIFDKHNSKYKLVIYLKDTFISKYPQNKIIGPKNNMIVEYSILKYDKQKNNNGLNRLINKRINGEYKGRYTTALIYNNTTKQLIKKFKFDIEQEV
jgi:hypothetical protein